MYCPQEKVLKLIKRSLWINWFYSNAKWHDVTKPTGGAGLLSGGVWDQLTPSLLVSVRPSLLVSLRSLLLVSLRWWGSTVEEMKRWIWSSLNRPCSGLQQHEKLYPSSTSNNLFRTNLTPLPIPDKCLLKWFGKSCSKFDFWYQCWLATWIQIFDSVDLRDIADNVRNSCSTQ